MASWSPERTRRQLLSVGPQLTARRSQVTFVAFDLLAITGRSVVGAPYEERKQLLADLCLMGPAGCTLPRWVDMELSDLLTACELHGLEGVVAKRLCSKYRPGRRSEDCRR